MGLGPRDPAGIYQAQVGAERPAGRGQGGAGQRGPPGCAGRGRPAGPMPPLQLHPWHGGHCEWQGASFPYPSRASSPCPGTWYGPQSRFAASQWETLTAELLRGQGYYHPRPICTDGKTEARRGEGICPGSHSTSAQACNPQPLSPSMLLARGTKRKRGRGEPWALGRQRQLGKRRKPMAGVGPPSKARAPPPQAAVHDAERGVIEAGLA